MKNFNFIITLFFTTVLFVSCSKDDSDGGGGKTGSAPDGVPTGEIVPVSQRNEILTGFNEVNGQARPAGSNGQEKQIWWWYVEGRVSSENCQGYDQELENGYWIAFTPNGKILYKYQWEDETFGNKTYEWINPRTKTGLILNNQSEVLFSRLNPNDMTWYSEQKYGDCTVLTWETMDNPRTE